MDLMLVFLLFFIPSYTASNVQTCTPSSCSDTGPQVRFPFRLKNRQPYWCGYPGFDLSCNSQGQTIINLQLPLSGEFLVKRIDYISQSIYINDPKHCLPKRLLEQSLWDSTFRPAFLRNYTFFKCSSNWSANASDQRVILDCLGGNNNTYIAAPSDGSSADIDKPSSCKNVSRVSVPVQSIDGDFERSTDFSMDLQLIWVTPRCSTCEAEGGICGYNDGDIWEIGCTNPPRRGLPRSAKYAIILGVGIPVLLCMIGLICYTLGRIKYYGQSRHWSTTELSTTTIVPQIPATGNGLDPPTIESYPKTVLGDSGRLPNPNDGTCSICLSEYQPKDALRTLPECNHYFHASCIDEWLRLNATCPLCRISPVSSSVFTRCSSTSSSSTTSPMPPL